MKKIYSIPVTSAMEALHELPLATSGVGSEDKGIGYGGVDEEGTMEPETKGNPFGSTIFD